MTTSDPANPVEQYNVILSFRARPRSVPARIPPRCVSGRSVKKGSPNDDACCGESLATTEARSTSSSGVSCADASFGPTVVTCVPTSIQPASITGWAARVARITTVASRVASSADPVDRAGRSSSSTARSRTHPGGRGAGCTRPRPPRAGRCSTPIVASTPDAQIDHTPARHGPTGARARAAAPPSPPVRLAPSSHPTTIPSIRPSSSQTTTS